MIADVICSFAPCIFSGSPCDIIILYPADIRLSTAIPPEIPRRIPNMLFTKLFGSVLQKPKAVLTPLQPPFAAPPLLGIGVAHGGGGGVI